MYLRHTIRKKDGKVHCIWRLVRSVRVGRRRRARDWMPFSPRCDNSGGAKAATSIHRDELVALAARHRLPAIYPYRIFVRAGGLSCYTPDIVDQYRQAATYVDRILKGEKPGEMAIQAPNKFELVINLKTARSLGLTVPSAVLTRADELIE